MSAPAIESAALGMSVHRARQIEQAANLARRQEAYYAGRIREAKARFLARKADPERKRLDAAAAETESSLSAIIRQQDAERERRAAERRRQRDMRVLGVIVSNEDEWRWVERVALHEAGHAVANWFDGSGVDGVGLILAENPARCEGGYTRPRDEELKTAGAVLSGIAAERIAGFSARDTGTDSDVRKARDLLPIGKRSDADIEREIGRAADYLRKQWAAVTALAREIRLRADLDGEEAERIIGQALRYRDAA